MFFKKKKKIQRLEAELEESKKETAKYRELYIQAVKAYEGPCDGPAPKGDSKRYKVPHCSTCPSHERVGLSGKLVHRCATSGGKIIRGNDARVSPHWCPLRDDKLQHKSKETHT